MLVQLNNSAGMPCSSDTEQLRRHAIYSDTETLRACHVCPSDTEQFERACHVGLYYSDTEQFVRACHVGPSDTEQLLRAWMPS